MFHCLASSVFAVTSSLSDIPCCLVWHIHCLFKSSSLSATEKRKKKKKKEILPAEDIPPFGAKGSTCFICSCHICIVLAHKVMCLQIHYISASTSIPLYSKSLLLYLIVLVLLSCIRTVEIITTKKTCFCRAKCSICVVIDLVYCFVSIN